MNVIVRWLGGAHHFEGLEEVRAEQNRRLGKRASGGTLFTAWCPRPA